MADLSKHELSESAVFEPILPDGSKSDAKITLAGRDSDVYNKAMVEASRNRLKRKIEKGEDPFEEMSTKDSDDFTIPIIAACTLSWEGVEWEGEPMECTPENAEKLYRNPKLGWLKRQVDRFIHRTGNYLGKPKQD